MPDNESVLYVPLRSNAKTLVTGTPIAALRRRLKYASVFQDQLFLESGVLRMQAGEGGSSSFAVPVTADQPARWQTPRQRQLAQQYSQVVAQRFGEEAGWKLRGYAIAFLFPQIGEWTWQEIVDLRRDPNMAYFRAKLREIENEAAAESSSGDLEAAVRHAYGRHSAAAVPTLTGFGRAAATIAVGYVISSGSGLMTFGMSQRPARRSRQRGSRVCTGGIHGGPRGLPAAPVTGLGDGPQQDHRLGRLTPRCGRVQVGRGRRRLRGQPNKTYAAHVGSLRS